MLGFFARPGPSPRAAPEPAGPRPERQARRPALGQASLAAPAEPAWSGPGVAAPPGAASVAARRNIPIRSARWRTALWQLWCSSGRSLPALIGFRGLPAALAHGARDARPPLLKTLYGSRKIHGQPDKRNAQC